MNITLRIFLLIVAFLTLAFVIRKLKKSALEIIDSIFWVLLAVLLIVAGLFIGSSVVYYARIQPVIFGIPVIGFVGYIVAFLLGIWIARDIIRDARRHRR